MPNTRKPGQNKYAMRNFNFFASDQKYLFAFVSGMCYLFENYFYDFKSG